MNKIKDLVKKEILRDYPGIYDSGIESGMIPDYKVVSHRLYKEFLLSLKKRNSDFIAYYKFSSRSDLEVCRKYLESTHFDYKPNDQVNFSYIPEFLCINIKDRLCIPSMLHGEELRRVDDVLKELTTYGYDR